MADDAIQIAPAGDVILLVMKEGNTVLFRANSAALRMASVVFETMLGPKFAEGNALATQTGSLPCEVKLEGDDPKCMELILRTTHLQHDDLPDRVNCDDIISLANLIDKYFLHQAMKLVLDKWLIPTKTSNLHNFLQAAVTLGHADSFKETTRLMILTQTDSYSRQICMDKDAKFLHYICK